MSAGNTRLNDILAGIHIPKNVILVEYVLIWTKLEEKLIKMRVNRVSMRIVCHTLKACAVVDFELTNSPCSP